MNNHLAILENFDATVRVNTNERECGDCTYCCEGWLTCNIFGYDVLRGSPCKFVIPNKGCGAYDFRPYDPCKTFKCYYREDSIVPDQFKPSIIGNIMIYRTMAGIPYLDIIEAKNPLNIDLLNWVLEQYRDGKIDSLRYFLYGEPNWITRDPEFDKVMRKEYNKKVFSIIEVKQ